MLFRSGVGLWWFRVSPVSSGSLGSVKRMVRAYWLVIPGLVLATACGYFMSGTWKDDPGNWRRAFRSDPPEYVVVVHSQYSRFPHFTHESVYFFQLEPNEQLMLELFRQNEMRKLDPSRLEAALSAPGERPDWFVPGPAKDYDAWVYAEEPAGNFRLFVERGTGKVFIVDWQL